MNRLAAPLAIACFDPVEWRTLAALLHDGREEAVRNSRHPLRRGWILGLEVTLLRLPFGDQPQLLKEVLDQYLKQVRPRMLLILGTCLVLAPGLEPGQVVRVETAHYQGRTLRTPPDPSLPSGEISPPGIPIHPVETITVDRFVPSSSRAEELRREVATAAVAEMEDFHVFSMARRRKVPFLSLRVITDRGSFRDHLRYIPAAATLQSRLLCWICGVLRIRDNYHWHDSQLRPSLPERCVVERLDGALTIPEAVSAMRRFAPMMTVNEDSHPGTVYVIRLGLTADDPPGELAVIPELGKLYRRDMIADEWPSFTALPALHSAHVQGVNSVSAEPVEGWLAAMTVAELRKGGVQTVAAADTDYWIYRTADTAITDYFRPEHPVPWPAPWPPPGGVRLVATGSGPRIDPGSPAGRHADLLLAGDESGGRLLHLLNDLGGRPVTAVDVFAHRGVSLRLNPSTIVFSGCGVHAFLTPAALQRQEIQPEDVRRIYSEDYDRFFHRYFPAADPERPSLLFSTSRGCGKRCAICCCGGHVPWTPLSEDHLVEFLRHGLREAEKTSGQPVKLLDVFLLDSEFNGMRGRLGTLTRRLETENLLGVFRFHVRHNSVHGFLLPGPTGERSVDRDALRSCRKLGMDEVVIGVDGWTDASLRMLKTDVRRLAEQGERARPFCTVSEVEAVLAAAAEEGLGIRAFLLSGNPFSGDDERVESFYRLLRLGWRYPRFRLDTESSSAVNLLKPFPGSPLAAIVKERPDWCRNGRFIPRGILHPYPRSGFGPLLGQARQTEEEKLRYWREGQRLRLELIGLLAGFKPLRDPDVSREWLAASRTLIMEEETIFQNLPILTDRERIREVHIREMLVTLCRRQPGIPVSWKNPREEWFYRQLRGNFHSGSGG